MIGLGLCGIKWEYQPGAHWSGSIGAYPHELSYGSLTLTETKGSRAIVAKAPIIRICPGDHHIDDCPDTDRVVCW